MNKQVLMLALISLALLATTSLAMAIGPQKAERNPHVTITPETPGMTAGGAELVLPSGVVNEWMADTNESVMDIVHIKNATKFRMRTAEPVELDDLITLYTDPVASLEYENRWGFVSYEVLEAFFDWLISIGAPIPPEEVEMALSMYPEGMYIMFVNVGK